MDPSSVKRALVEALESNEVVDSSHLSLLLSVPHSSLVGSLKSLQAGGMVEVESYEIEKVNMSKEGEEYAEKGTPEAQVFHAVLLSPSLPQSSLRDLPALSEVFQVGFGTAMKNKWINMDKHTKLVEPMQEEIEDKVQSQLRFLLSSSSLPLSEISEKMEGGGKGLEALKKRKLISVGKMTAYRIRKTEKFSASALHNKAETDLTAQMILDGSWKNSEFKNFNLKSLGKDLQGGHLHPLLKVKSEIRNIFLLMGFEEMETNRYVESSFWNFDALFQPQQHPARDAQDTFFITHPSTTSPHDFSEEYLKKVKDTHEEGGGTGSCGYRMKWSQEEARKTILRTHTTAVSSRYLYEMGQDYQKTGVFKPRKCFSIDRVFRNETLDATHLAEFHQVEGFIADRGLTLGDLIGTLTEFYRRLGMTGLELHPTYNPYTEPSMEIFVYHPGLKKRIELGNSGLFRPEMLRPMGLPEDVQVIAWGISVERPTMIKYGLSNIRDLFGHKMDVTSFKRSPLAWIKEGEGEEGGEEEGRR